MPAAAAAPEKEEAAEVDEEAKAEAVAADRKHSAVEPSSSSAAALAAAPAEPAPAGDIDLNKLAAKAMRAKLMGKMAEHDRLQAVISAAKADGSAAPPPPPAPPAATVSTEGGEERKKKTVQVSVPVEAVGCLIGKGGATIDAMQAETGARIRIPSGQETEGGAERVVLISGDEQALQAAQAVIEAKLAEHAERGAYPGRRLPNRRTNLPAHWQGPSPSPSLSHDSRRHSRQPSPSPSLSQDPRRQGPEARDVQAGSQAAAVAAADVRRSAGLRQGDGPADHPAGAR